MTIKNSGQNVDDILAAPGIGNDLSGANDTTDRAASQTTGDVLRDFVAKLDAEDVRVDAALQELADIGAYVNGSANLDAVCPWLSDYVSFSREWSPRSYSGYHEAVGIWLLSTVAARRVVMSLGGERYTSLYIGMVAPTSIWAKTSATGIGKDTLRAAGLDWLLALGDATPQKFFLNMSGYLPGNYEKLPPERQAWYLKKAAMPAQQGWYYEEFGGKLQAMLREGGPMVDFRSALRQLDDGEHEASSGTVGRGDEFVTKPYLAMLANMTPADLGKVANKGSALWGDGFLARWVLICPPPGAKRSKARFPKGKRIVPAGLVKTLRAWHERLGEPTATITADEDDKGKRTGDYTVIRQPLKETRLTFTDAAEDLYYRYHDALCDYVVAKAHPEDLDGNHTRFAEKAQRIAMLFASLANGDVLDVPQLAAAIQIVERWRAGLYELYSAVNSASVEDEQEDLVRRVVRIVERLEAKPGDPSPTAADIARYVRGKTTSEVANICQIAVDDRQLRVLASGRTSRYTARLYGDQ